MANVPETHKSSAMRLFDTALVVAGVIVAAMIALWALHAIVGLVLWVFKIAILAVIVIALVRLVTHRRR
jgi:fatty acid desaturase